MAILVFSPMLNLKLCPNALKFFFFMSLGYSNLIVFSISPSKTVVDIFLFYLLNSSPHICFFIVNSWCYYSLTFYKWIILRTKNFLIFFLRWNMPKNAIQLWKLCQIVRKHEINASFSCFAFTSPSFQQIFRIFALSCNCKIATFRNLITAHPYDIALQKREKVLVHYIFSALCFTWIAGV